MKKQIIVLLVLLFSIFIMDKAGLNYFEPANANNVFSTLQTDSNNLDTVKLYSSEAFGMRSKTLEGIDSIVKNGISLRVFPGCQVLVMKDGKTVYNKCFGNYEYESTQQVQPNTLYDLASLSKTTGTLLAVMKLYDNGKLKLADKASDYLTFLRGTNKEDITIKELLFHETGLPAGLPFHGLAIEKNNTAPFLVGTKDTTHTVRLPSTTMKYKENWVSKIPSVEFMMQVSDSFYVHNRLHDAAMQMIASTRLGSKTYLYSCVNFILIKEIVEVISGMSMDVLLDNEFFIPMKLKNMAYLPLRSHKKEEIAPTIKKDFLRNGLLQGYVHDPDAAFLGGISGNAGLFATARDVATVHQMLLNDGELNGKRYLSAETCKLFTTTTSVSGRRGLGFDKPYSANTNHNPCSASAPAETYGHTGYTGTCCWVDPVNKLIYVFLSNRTYPNDGVNKLARMSIRPKIQEVIYQSMRPCNLSR
jgi:CubicO group peptidase (beta-lactamase class C family)